MRRLVRSAAATFEIRSNLFENVHNTHLNLVAGQSEALVFVGQGPKKVSISSLVYPALHWQAGGEIAVLSYTVSG